MTRDISSWIEGWAIQRPAGLALVDDERALDYQTFHNQVLATHAALDGLGVRRGDRVAVLNFNSIEQISLLFACARIGAILVPLNWRLTVVEHEFMLDDCQPVLLIYEDRFESHCARVSSGVRQVSFTRLARECNAEQSVVDDDIAGNMARTGTFDDAVLLMYTAGTTGKPKGALLTQSALHWNAVNAVHAHEMTPDDRVLTDLPMFHVGGLNIQTLPALFIGATVRVLPRFDVDRAVAAIEAFRPTVYLMVPATISALVGDPRWGSLGLDSLRVIMTGSSTVPLALIEAIHERGVPVGQIYGSTETCPIATYLSAHDAVAHAGSCGKAAPHCEIRVVDRNGEPCGSGVRGEIQVRGPNVTVGYWRNQAANEAAFNADWFCTGDVGHFDEMGYLYIDDRLNDVVISGGEQIYPAELENVLARVDGISEYAVVGLPHEKWVEVPVAVLVRSGDCLASESDLIDHIQARFESELARFKHPKDYRFLDALPRNAMGKVLKHELRQRLDNAASARG
jgi:fatty-acyl-CoA synthase